MAADEIVLEHPNRETAASKSTRVVVVGLLLVSILLLVLITVGGWDALTGARTLQVVWIFLYGALAFLIIRWRSGMLPLTAALAALLLVFAAIATPAWMARDAEGFTDPTLPSGLLGLFTGAVVPVQVLLIGFALRGFSQRWNVEVERLPDGSTRRAGVWS